MWERPRLLLLLLLLLPATTTTTATILIYDMPSRSCFFAQRHRGAATDVKKKTAAAPQRGN